MGLVILNEMLILTDCLDYSSLCACVASSTRGHVELKPKDNLKNRNLKKASLYLQLYNIFFTVTVILKAINLTFTFGIPLLRGSVATV